ncbi:MAG: bifunctional riboflavin kinase/FMN adenylyltransferase [bacterium]
MRLIRLTTEYLTRIMAGDDHLPRGEIESCALSLGSFDGLHRGHQQLIKTVQNAKTQHGLAASCLFTFRRHPRLILDDKPEPFLLTTWREKLSLLTDSGLDVVVAADFCPALASLSYQDFVGRFLVEFLGMSHFVTGYDVHLGADRRGTADSLAELGKQLGYSFEIVPALSDAGQTISSSTIRQSLGAGDLAAATRMLGRPYALWGEVVPGENRGRSIGYPTANLLPLFEYKLLPAPGVYAVKVQLPGDVARVGAKNGILGRVTESLPELDRNGSVLSMAPSEWAVCGGMLNFGRVPTFHDSGLPVPRVEAHIFDFDGDIRGRTVKVEWLSRLREEQKFDSVAELVKQLELDEQAARAVIAASL